MNKWFNWASRNFPLQVIHAFRNKDPFFLLFFPKVATLDLKLLRKNSWLEISRFVLVVLIRSAEDARLSFWPSRDQHHSDLIASAAAALLLGEPARRRELRLRGHGERRRQRMAGQGWGLGGQGEPNSTWGDHRGQYGATRTANLNHCSYTLVLLRLSSDASKCIRENVLSCPRRLPTFMANQGQHVAV